MSRITDEMMQRGIKIGIEIGKERALKMYAAAVRVYRQVLLQRQQKRAV